MDYYLGHGVVSKHERLSEDVFDGGEEHNGKEQLVAFLGAEQVGIDKRHEQRVRTYGRMHRREGCGGADVWHGGATRMVEQGKRGNGKGRGDTQGRLNEQLEGLNAARSALDVRTVRITRRQTLDKYIANEFTQYITALCDAEQPLRRIIGKRVIPM
jgi:hypothetical protein